MTALAAAALACALLGAAASWTLTNRKHAARVAQLETNNRRLATDLNTLRHVHNRAVDWITTDQTIGRCRR